MSIGKRIAALERRRDYLTAKIDEGNYSDNAAGWAQAEVRALNWAISRLCGEPDPGIDERIRRDIRTAVRAALRLARENPNMPDDQILAAVTFRDPPTIAGRAS